MTVPPRHLYGVLVTFRRPAALAITLERLAHQDRRLDRLVVVDNAPSDDSRAAVSGAAAVAGSVEHLEMDENVGFTGGVAAGMRRVLQFADDRDLIVVLDDDDPVPYLTIFSDLERFAEDMLRDDPRTAGVAITGGRFDWKRGRIQRVPDRELHGPVAVDHLAGNQVPFYLVGAVRSAGTFHAPLFFGLSELEFGLRLTRAGLHLLRAGRHLAPEERGAGPTRHRRSPRVAARPRELAALLRPAELRLHASTVRPDRHRPPRGRDERRQADRQPSRSSLDWRRDTSPSISEPVGTGGPAAWGDRWSPMPMHATRGKPAPRHPQPSIRKGSA